MARRLEASDQKAKELAKKLGSYSFNNEEGEEYGASTFGGLGDYMRNKRTKLQNRDAHIRAEHASSHAPIFRGLAIWINGETFPTPYELGQLIVKHSGVRFQYLYGKTQVTHIIASNLTLKKRVEFARYKVVKPEWITESIEAGVLLPWSDFRLVDETPAQKKLNFVPPADLATPVRGNIDNGGSLRGMLAEVSEVGDRSIAVPGSSFIKRAMSRRLSAAGPSGTGKVADRPIAKPRLSSTRWAANESRPGLSLRSKDITIPPSDEPDADEDDQFPSYQPPANNTRLASILSYQPQQSFNGRDKLIPPSRQRNSRDFSSLFREGEKQQIAQDHGEGEDEYEDLVNLVLVPPTSPALPKDTANEYNMVPPKLNIFSLKSSSPPPNTFPPPVVQKTARTRKAGTSLKPLELEQLKSEPSPTPGPSSRPEAVTIIKGQKAYEVEAFIDERIHPKRKNRRAWTEYLVSWEGYPLGEASWEPERQLKQDLKDGEFDRLLREWRNVQCEGSGSESGDGSGNGNGNGSGKFMVSVEIPQRVSRSLDSIGAGDFDRSIQEPIVERRSMVAARQPVEESQISGGTTYGSTPSEFMEQRKEKINISVDTSVIAPPLADSREIRDSLSPDDIMDEDEDFGWGVEEQRILDNEGDLFNKMIEESTIISAPPSVPTMTEPGQTEETLQVASQGVESLYGTPVDFTEDFMEETLGEELNVRGSPKSTVEDVVSPVDFTDLMQEDEKEEPENLDTLVDLDIVEDIESFEMGFLTPVDLLEEREILPETQRPLEVVESTEQSFEFPAETPIPPLEETPHSEMTAEQKMAAYLSNPGIREQTCLNPGFLQKYHEESRLHQLSTWKAKLRAELQALADTKSSSGQVKPKKSRQRRYILHVDFDCFFAAVSTRDRPDLAGKPVAITHGNAGNSTSSDIASCNYAAREFGVKNGMWMEEARKLCPGIICLPYEFLKYEEASKTFYDVILSKNAEKVQAVSVDEVLMDVSNLCCDVGLESEEEEEAMAAVIANEIRESCRERTGGLEVSVGISGNVLLAKLATKKAKPAGQYLIKSAVVAEFMSGVVVRELPGIGYNIATKVEGKLGTNKVGEVRGFSKERLKAVLGEKTGEKLWGYCRGLDDTVVGQTTVRKSVSVDVNWGIRFENQEQAEDFLTDIAEEVEKRMKQEGVKGKHLTLKVNKRAQNAPFITPKHLGCGKCDSINKSITLGVATTDKYTIGKEAVMMLRLCRVSPGELRGLGLTMTRLEEIQSGKADSSQKNFDYFKKKEDLVKKDTDGGNPPEVMREEQNIPPERPLIKAYVKPRVTTLLDSFSKISAGRNQLIQVQQKFDALMGTQIDIPVDMDPDVIHDLLSEYKNPINQRGEENNEIQEQERVEEDLLLSQPLSQPPPGSQYDLGVWKQLGSEMRSEIIAEHKEESRRRARATVSPSKGQSLPPQGLQRSRSLLRETSASVTPPQSPKRARPLPFGKNGPGSPAKKKRGRPSGARAGPSGASANQDRILDMKGNDVSGWLFSEGKVDREWFDAVDEGSRQFQIAQAVKARELEHEATRKRELKDAAERERLANAVRLPAPSRQYTLGGDKLVGTMEQIRNTLSDWYKQCEEMGPHEDDTEEFAKFLRRLILVEHNLCKADEMVRHFLAVIGYDNKDWICVVEEFAKVVNGALAEMGLGPIDFEIG